MKPITIPFAVAAATLLALPLGGAQRTSAQVGAVPPADLAFDDASNRRSPFESAPATLVGGQSAIQPDAKRRRGPLEAHPLSELRMVGTIAADGENHALVEAPDGTIHRMTKGDYLGKDDGRIASVGDSDIALVETVRDGGGGWMRRTRLLPIATDAATNAASAGTTTEQTAGERTIDERTIDEKVAPTQSNADMPPSADAVGEESTPPTNQAGTGEPSQGEPTTGKVLTLNFQDIDIRRALQLIADFADVNLVATETVTGKVTLRLAAVPWQEALQLIVVANGLDKRLTGAVLLVAPAEEIAAREQLALENRKALAELVPPQTRFVEVRYANAAALAELLADVSPESESKERTRVLVDERTNSLILTGTADGLAALAAMIARLDVPIRQVQIEARIVNANNNFSEQLGIRWGISLNTKGVAVVSGPADTTAAVGARTDGGSAARADVTGAGFWLDMELSASEAAGQAQIVARPKVVTTDKRAATIESGVEIPYQQATKSGATSIAFKDAVLQLQVTPHITPNRRIVVDLEVKQDTVGRIYHGVPSINTTRIATQVLVDDSATVVLGGIFQTDRHHTVARTPLLGKVPVLGRAFRRTTERDDQQELFIFITPSIVDDAVEAAARTAGTNSVSSPDSAANRTVSTATEQA